MLSRSFVTFFMLAIGIAPLLAARTDTATVIRKGKKGIVTSATKAEPIFRGTKLALKTEAQGKNKTRNLTARATANALPANHKLMHLHPKAQLKMKAALTDMEKAGVCPLITSAYRSTQEQREIYHCSHRHICKVRRGIFSARKPGTSLHEAGLAVDLADVAYGKKHRRRLTREGKQMVKIMQQHGFDWRYGLKDPAHFELKPQIAGYRTERQAIAAAQIRTTKSRQQAKIAAKSLVSANPRRR